MRRFLTCNFVFVFVMLLSLKVIIATEKQLDIEVESQSLPPGFQPFPSHLNSETKSTFQFETQVNRLMKLIINSLYKSKDIFLRELISNASDALDKIRFLSLKKKENLGDHSDLNITIVLDKNSNTLTISDSGIGMTKKDLRENLGTIAKSGTSEFIEAFEKGNVSDASKLIGQFGVGFYSVFLVADSVSVVTKNNQDKQYIWESNSENDFTIYEDPRGNTLGRGTSIILHLKKEAQDYLDTEKITKLIETHSQFIQFPIYLWTTKTVTEDVVIEPEAEKLADESEEDVTEEQKTKKVEKKISNWELVNKQKPIWTRSPSQVSKEEYDSFYKAFTKDYSDPVAYSHFRAEGDVEFFTLLFVPKFAPSNLLQKGQVYDNIKLFVRRVFITDDIPDLLPKFLSFIKGLVDSDDLPLNVSRETLQQNALLKMIKKKLLAKALDMLKSIMEDKDKSQDFYKEYSNALKMGIIEDQKIAPKIIPLLRFYSSKSESKMISLDDYIKNMKQGQKQIFFMIGDSVESLKTSPFVENLISKGYEILYMTEPIDDYIVNSPAFKTIQEKPTQNIAKAGVALTEQDESKAKALEEEFKPLIEKLSKKLETYISNVRISQQLTKSPCAVIAPEMALSASMERILKSQAIGKKDDMMLDYYMKQKYIFEINPEHPIMKRLLEKVKEQATDLDDTIDVLFESTVISSGYSVRNPAKFANKIQNVIRNHLGLPNEVHEDKVKESEPLEEEEPHDEL